MHGANHAATLICAELSSGEGCIAGSYPTLLLVQNASMRAHEDRKRREKCIRVSELACFDPLQRKGAFDVQLAIQLGTAAASRRLPAELCWNLGDAVIRRRSGLACW